MVSFIGNEIREGGKGRSYVQHDLLYNVIENWKKREVFSGNENVLFIDMQIRFMIIRLFWPFYW